MKRWRDLGLVQRLVLATLLVGFVTALVGSTLLRTSARRALRQQVEARNVGVADRLSISLDDRVRANIEFLRILAADQRITALQPSAVAELNVALRTGLFFERLVLFDGSGRPVAAVASRALVDVSDIDQRPGITDGLEAQDGTVALTEGGPPKAVISVPVEDPPGTVVGALVAELLVEGLAERVDARFLDPALTSLVVDREGRILVHQDRDRVVREEVYPLESLLSQEDQVTILDGSSGTVVAAAGDSELFPGAVVVEQPTEVAFGPAAESVTQLTLILLVVLLSTVAVAALVGRQILHPLVELGDTVEHFAHGDHTVRAQVAGAPEVRSVAGEFNRMADSLDAHIEERQKVEEYKRELADAERKRQQALEINDNVVQGLAVSLYSLDFGQPDKARSVLQETLRSARAIITDLLNARSPNIEPGDLVRSRPASLDKNEEPS